MTMTDCKLYGPVLGIRVHNSGHATLENCEIYGQKQRAIYVRAKGEIVVKTSKVHDSLGVNVLADGRGMFEDCEIYGNDVGVFLAEEGKAERWIRVKSVIASKQACVFRIRAT